MADFEGTEFAKAHAWPRVIETMRAAAHWNDVRDNWQYNYPANVRMLLKELYDDDDVFND